MRETERSDTARRRSGLGDEVKSADKETDSLARQVARLTSGTLTEAIRSSLRARLRHEQLKRGEGPELAKALQEIAKRCAPPARARSSR